MVCSIANLYLVSGREAERRKEEGRKRLPRVRRKVSLWTRRNFLLAAEGHLKATAIVDKQAGPSGSFGAWEKKLMCMGKQIHRTRPDPPLLK